MERVVLDRLERKLDERVKERFPDGVIQRVALLQHGEDPAVEPGELLVRVFIGPAGAPETREQSMKAWENELKGWEKLWKELSSTAGRTEDAIRAADFARFGLRRLARSRPEDDPDSALAILKAAGPELQDALLGPAAGYLGDRPVVVVPPGKLHSIPWALLPALGDRVFSVAPSAGAWMRAHAAPPPGRRHVTLARGPGLVTAGAEVPLVAQLYDDVTVLSGA